MKKSHPQRPRLMMRHLRVGAIEDGVVAVENQGRSLPNRDELIRTLSREINDSAQPDMVSFTARLRMLPLKVWSPIIQPPRVDLARAVEDRLVGLDARIMCNADSGDVIAGYATGLGRAGDIDALTTELVTALSDPFEIDEMLYRFEARVGVATYDPSRNTASLLLRASELALAETTPSSPASIYTNAVGDRRHREDVIGNDLWVALRTKLLDVMYEPIVSGDGVVVGLEMRPAWGHDDLGTVHVGEILRVAEQSNQTFNVGEYLLRETAAAQAEWLGIPEDVRFWINITPADMLNPSFVDLLAERSADFNLGIEIPEGRAMLEPVVAKIAEELGRAGIGTAVDEFGNDFSALSRLMSLPYSTLKLNSGLVHALAVSNEDRRIVSLAVDLAREFGIDVVACGLETREELDLVTAMGVTAMQGPLMGRPVMAEEVPRLISSSR